MSGMAPCHAAIRKVSSRAGTAMADAKENHLAREQHVD
jgi:hypothetical protein